MSMTEETKTKLESSAGDLSDVENGNCSSSGSGGDTKKACVDCGTSKTPLWRGGPAGPKSLCNACGIKSRKKRQASLGISTEDSKMKKNKISSSNSNNNLVLENVVKNKKMIMKTDQVENHRIVKAAVAESVNVVVKKKMIMKRDSSSSSSSENKKNVKRVNKFLDLGFKVPVMKRSAIEKKRIWRKLGEEEQAAVLLMTLSCG